MSSPQEFYDAREGYFIKLNDEALIQRYIGYRIFQGLVTKPGTIEQFMPLDTDKINNVKAMPSKAQWAKMKKMHKVK